MILEQGGGRDKHRAQANWAPWRKFPLGFGVADAARDPSTASQLHIREAATPLRMTEG